MDAFIKASPIIVLLATCIVSIMAGAAAAFKLKGRNKETPGYVEKASCESSRKGFEKLIDIKFENGSNRMARIEGDISGMARDIKETSKNVITLMANHGGGK